MRVFFVRPSDNGNYGIEAALATVRPPVEELHLALFRGCRVPLEPTNFAGREHGFASLGRYDLVILAGLDPVALSAAEQLALVAFVERGGGLLLLGGSHSFGNAEGTYQLLEPILPVRVLRGLDVEVNVMPSGSAHPIARGLPTPLGYVGKVHPVEAKPEAHVAMRVPIAGDGRGELPLVVVGERGYGRVVVVASYPECEESEYGWFFTGDAFDDFIRGAAAWLRKEWEGVWFESFSLPNRQVVVGNEEFGRVKLGCAEETPVRLVTRLTDARGRVAHESATSLPAKRTHEAVFSFRVADDPKARGVHYVAVIASSAAGIEIARRDVAIEVVNPTRVSVGLEYGRRVFFPGDTAQVRLRVASALKEPPEEVALDISLVDEQERPVVAPRRRLLRRRENAYEDVELSLPVPRLRPGCYRLRVELRIGEELADLAGEDLFVLAPSGAREGFPLIADGGYHLDRGSTERAIEQLIRAGVNTLSVPGRAAWPERSRGLGRFDELPHREAMLTAAEEIAARAGLSLAHHRRGLVPGLSVGAPLTRCALAPEFRQVLETEIRPVLAAASKAPSLRWHELAARAAVGRGQLCRCAACEAAYKRNLGSDLPSGDPASLSLAQRKELAAFVTSYWWHVFASVQKLRDEAAAGVKLAMGFDAASFLRDGPDAPFCDPLVWARACERGEVAAERELPRFRLSLAGHQAVFAALGKPFGAQVDVAETIFRVGDADSGVRPSGADGVPPAEAAYTALLRGASHLRVTENPRFLFFRRQAPLDAALGGLFERLARAGPLLALTSRPSAPVALLFPFSEVAASGSGCLLAAFELLQAAVGDVDLLHERLVTDDSLAAYGAVATLGTSLLPKRVAAALARFVERGGLLLADRLEVRDEDGGPMAWPEGFFGTSETPLFAEISGRRRRFGAGRTMLFSGDLVGCYRQARESGDEVAARELRRVVEESVAERGVGSHLHFAHGGYVPNEDVTPRARARDPLVEVGVRTCADTWLLVAVNHSDEARTTQVDMDAEAVPAVCAYDLATGESVPVERGRGIAVAIRLGARDGGLWVLYPERPFTLRLEAPLSTGCRGGSLRYRVLVVNESGRPAQGCYLVRTAVSDPSGEERGEFGGERVATNGVLEVSEPLAQNERPGTWTIRATDPLTRRVVRRTLEVRDESEGDSNGTRVEDAPS